MKPHQMRALGAVEACLARIGEDPLHAWAAVDPQFARRQAQSLRPGGLLEGMPIGVKDIFDTADLPTEYGSPIYKGHRPAWDAAVVAAARAAGGIVLGKTVTTEFATMVPARTVHPLDPRRTPGGSSSGSAAAVAAGMVRLAFGTQTVGSTIRPAAYCGVVGFKPSYGVLSRSGMKMGAESLDTVGLIARNVEDVALFAAACAMRTFDLPVLEKPRLGICRSPNWSHMSPEGAQHFDRVIERLGAKMVDAELPGSFASLDEAAARILTYEMARGLAHEMAHHRDRIHPVLRARIEDRAATQTDEYLRALEYAADCRRRLAEHAKDLDALITPSATGEAPLGLESTGNTAMNRLWTLLHGPCITVPAGEGPAGMPLGVQLVRPAGGDAHLLAVAPWVERHAK